MNLGSQAYKYKKIDTYNKYNFWQKKNKGICFKQESDLKNE